MFEIVYDDDDDGRTTDGRRIHGYNISSPCEPNGSGELKTVGSKFSRAEAYLGPRREKTSFFHMRKQRRRSAEK